MPGVEIKAAIATLLTAAFSVGTGDGRLKSILTQYPRPGTNDGPTQFPRVVIWGTRHGKQQVQGGGRSGVLSNQPTPPIGNRVQPWDMTIHLKHLLDDPITQGAAYDQLADDIETLLTQWPTLNNASGTTAAGSVANTFNAMDWKVGWSGGLSRENIPPLPAGELQVSYNTLITVTVEEWIKA